MKSNFDSFLSPYPERISIQDLKTVIQNNRTPFFIYDQTTLLEKTARFQPFFNAHPEKFLLLYAIKANSNRNLIQLFDRSGLHFDASSIFEVERMIKIGINPQKITLTAQEIFEEIDLRENDYLNQIHLNASSLHQIELIGELFGKKKYLPSNGSVISVRINPGKGSGIDHKTNVAGIQSGFGIWYESIPEIKKIAQNYGLSVGKIHTHIGSGTDPKVWAEVAEKSLELLHDFPQVNLLNLGGGFKIARHRDDFSTNIDLIQQQISHSFEKFYQTTKRKITLALEPGTYLVAESGLLIAKVIDLVSTGKKGIKFIKLDCGMNDFMRPILYQAKHQVDLIPSDFLPITDSTQLESYRILGHCCESSDQLTMGYERYSIQLPRVKIGDYLVIHGVGAYGSSLSSSYNSFPLSAEFLKTTDGKIQSIRKRGTVEDIIQNEVVY